MVRASELRNMAATAPGTKGEVEGPMAKGRVVRSPRVVAQDVGLTGGRLGGRRHDHALAETRRGQPLGCSTQPGIALSIAWHALHLQHETSLTRGSCGPVHQRHHVGYRGSVEPRSRERCRDPRA